MKAPALLLFFCLAALAFPQDQPTPILSGYVTRAASPSDFDVNGVRILCGHETLTAPTFGSAYTSGCPRNTPYIGLAMDVYGKRQKKLNAIAADHLVVRPVRRDDISGTALIDEVTRTAATPSASLLIRADGYPILITPATAATFDAPLHSLADIDTNLWIEYHAQPGPGGLYLARSARFYQNVITIREDQMRASTDYDPSAVPLNARPNPVAIAVGMGVDPKRIPPWPNPDMQKRLNTVGQKLVPAWERRLAPNDPSRIDFRFQVTDGKRWPLTLALPSGVILVPYEVLDRLPNDSQLAEVLADNIACVLEKQDYRMRFADNLVKAGNVASWAGFVPVVGAAAGIAGVGAEVSGSVILRKEEAQSGRVSLDLMHDAGYDLAQAPIAWWLLASRKPRRIQDIPIPARAAYLYRVLGAAWRPSTPATP